MMTEKVLSSNTVRKSDAARDPLRLIEYVPASAGRVLDFGCGAGARGRALKARGVEEIVGVETMEVEDSAGAYDRVLFGDLDGMSFPFDGDYFDCVVCDGALARLRDPGPVLERIIEVMAPGGLLAAAVPNIQYYKTFLMLVEGGWTYEDSGIMARENLRFFTACEIQRLLHVQGFDTTRIASLSADPPASFPRDEDGGAMSGRVSVGPLSDEEYGHFLVEEFLVLARKADANRL